MQVFYSNKISNQTILIDGQEHIHLCKVLRKKEGDLVSVCNGNGLMVQGEIISISKKETVLKQTEILAQESVKQNNLVLAVAPTKSMDRYEWMIEKCTEIGVSRIVPFYSQHSERRRLKVDRLRLIAISAMKQSKTLFLPDISEALSYKEFLKSENLSEKYIAYMDEHTRSISEVISKIDRKKEVLIAIGPEGGFSEKEIQAAKDNNYSSITLGTKRLRTETAAVFCSAAYQLL